MVSGGHVQYMATPTWEVKCGFDDRWELHLTYHAGIVRHTLWDSPVYYGIVLYSSV